MSLTDSKVKNAKSLEKEYKLTDGFGIILMGLNTGVCLTVSKRNKEYSL